MNLQRKNATMTFAGKLVQLEIILSKMSFSERQIRSTFFYIQNIRLKLHTCMYVCVHFYTHTCIGHKTERGIMRMDKEIFICKCIYNIYTHLYLYMFVS